MIGGRTHGTRATAPAKRRQFLDAMGLATNTLAP
ncbi:hypothetical protein Thivi_1889 [Thiocystis violascens DSM 198]|uniref:Uncharacterized protein n=1 Tax=Thiocystis violascens (strain ATCC 17096 / DSM 198 / 6111) TaxID=765911 RepID=I3YA39_THIV6|nr:hypothetical protein Thivi_1889 [Thiocystis violascens DSM 198]